MNRIDITVPPTIKSLTYNPYGKKVYSEQVKDFVDLSDMNEIVFPDQVVKASSSFVQGFFSDIIDSLGVDAVDEHFKIVSPNNKLIACFKEGLL